MIIYLSADHRGFELKEKLKGFIESLGHTIEDLGAYKKNPTDDYPDYAAAVARKVAGDSAGARGIIICGSGVGADITANRFRGVRCGLAVSAKQIASARHDDDINVLSLAANEVEEEAAKEIVRTFLMTGFATDERFARRLEKIESLTSPESG